MEVPLKTNFSRGGIKALVERLSKEQENVNVEGITYAIGLVCDCT
jgi:hypothetical protein